MTTQEELRFETDQRVRRGIRWAAAGKRAEALELLSRAVEEYPEHAFGQLHRAAALAEEGRIDEAKQALDKALALRPQEAAFHLFAGKIHFDAGSYSDARMEFERAAELSPGNLLVRGYLALTEWANGRDPLDVPLDPDDLPDSTPFLARLLMLIESDMKGRAEELLDDARPVKLLDRPRMAYVLWRAEGARKRGDLAAAFSYLEMALELYPGHSGALKTMHACRDEALAAAERRVEEDPASPEARVELADRLADAERFEEAEAALNEARRLLAEAGRAEEAESGESSRLAARVLYGLGRVDEALRAAEAGAEPGFTMSETHYYLGLCHLAREDRRRAVAEFERLVSKLWWAVPLRFREHLHWRRRVRKSA
jgi:tetratricopeptide (TPR) repeat protein